VDDAILMQFGAAFVLEKCVLRLVMTLWKMVTRKQNVRGCGVIIVLAYATFLLPLHISYIMQIILGLLMKGFLMLEGQLYCPTFPYKS
jgi:hypothetical protein